MDLKKKIIKNSNKEICFSAEAVKQCSVGGDHCSNLWLVSHITRLDLTKQENMLLLDVVKQHSDTFPN